MTFMIFQRGNRSLLAVVVPASIVALGAIPAASARPIAAAAPAPGWHVVKIIKGGVDLHDISALPAGKAWASGSVGTTTLTPVFYHRTGGRWVKVPRPGLASNNVFAGDISASSDSNVWGALANGSAVDHWNGHAWNRATFSPTFQVAVDGVLAFGTNHAKVFTFDFTSMQPDVTSYTGNHGTTKVLLGEIDGDSNQNLVSASSSSNIWAWSLDSAHINWQSLHFNGKTWSVAKVPPALFPNSADAPAQILALSPSNVWGTVVINGGNSPIVLLHWDGTKWRKAAGTPPPGELLGPIASDGHGGLWLAAGKATSKPPFIKPFFVHYSNKKFTSVAAPKSSLGPITISALAQIPGTQSLWAVGNIFSGESIVGAAIEQFRP